MPTPLRDRALVPTLFLVGLMVSLVSSLGAPLVPSIAAADGVSITVAQWSLTLTLLVGAVATPTLGRLGDGPHRRLVLLSTLTAVLAGSLLAALPFGFVVLLIGRGLQGLGLGLIPLVMAVARDHLPAARGRSTVSMLSVTGVAGVGLGYPVTGLLAEHSGVRGAFWFGVALSAVALAVAFVVIPSSSHRPARPFDLLGALLLGAGFAGVLLALADGQDWGWTSRRLIGFAVSALLVLAIWTRHELRSAHPLIDLRLMRHRGVLTANITGLLSGVGMYLMMSMVIRLVQTPTSTGYGLGKTVAVGGLILLPMSIASVVVSRLLPLLARRSSLGALLPVGTAVVLVAAVLFTVGRGSLWQIMVVMGVLGLGTGITVSAMPAMILRSVPTSETGSATGFNQVLRTAGYSIGSALSATILEAHTRTGEALPTDSGYQLGGYVGIGLGLLTIAVIVPLLPREAPAVNNTDEQMLREESLADAATEADMPVGVR